MVKHTQTIRRLLLMNYLSVFDHFVGLMLEELSLFSPVKVFLNRCFAQFHLRWSLRWVGGGGVTGTPFPYPAYLFSLINILSKCPIGFRHSGFYSVFILRYPGSLFTTIFFHTKLPNLFWKKNPQSTHDVVSTSIRYRKMLYDVECLQIYYLWRYFFIVGQLNKDI